MKQPYDAFLLVSFGGPERREDVIPFLENVLRGRNVPRERMLEVAEHYYHFGGVSPINRQNRELIAALAEEFAANAIRLPIYWGNRNWHPLLLETVPAMRDAGVKRALALVTSAFGSYSGCRQYRENIEAAREAVENAPVIDVFPPFFHHSGFIEAVADRVSDALTKLPGANLVYTAHSIPVSMARSSPYEAQLRDAASRVNSMLGAGEPVLVFQSRSGPPSQPWLGPDIGDYLRETESKRVVIVPIGFLSDHMEVLYDLDTQAAQIAAERNIQIVRAATVGTHPSFIRAIREMVQEVLENGPPPACAPDCCPPPTRP
ncbi:MAG TPA: ferrochelatase [Bryobacteraceae bacterium]|nr:ferrochelatase [Bryobacteraceae bacterium]